MHGDEQTNLWRLSGIGMEFAGTTVVLALVGYWIDQKYATSPWGAVIGLFVGFTGGFYLLIKQAMAANRKMASRNKSKRS